MTRTFDTNKSNNNILYLHSITIEQLMTKTKQKKVLRNYNSNVLYYLKLLCD